MEVGRCVILAYLGYALGAVFVGISAAVNARFGTYQGYDEFDRHVFVAMALAVDGLKVLIPIFAVKCFRARSYVFSGACFAMWIGAICWSLSGALGWSATSRGAVHSEADKYANDYRRAVAAVESLESQIAGLAPHRVASIVKQEIDSNSVRRTVFDRTGQCTTFDRDADKRECQPVLNLRAELAVSEVSRDLHARLSGARATLGGMETPKLEADPQAEALARTFGWLLGEDPATIRAKLSLLLALLVEAASAMVFTVTWIATAAPVVAAPTTKPGTPPAAAPVSAPGTALVTVPVAAPAAPPVSGTAAEPRRDPERFCTPTPYVAASAPPQRPATVRHEPAAAGPVSEVVTKPDTLPVTKPVTGLWRAPPLDVVDIWAQHRLDVVAGAAIRTSEAYADYVEWAGTQGMSPLSNQQFGVQAEPVIKRMGGEKVKRRDARYYEGVDLNARADA